MTKEAELREARRLLADILAEHSHVHGDCSRCIRVRAFLAASTTPAPETEDALQALLMVLNSELVSNDKHDWRTCKQTSCEMARSVLPVEWGGTAS